jgi:opacity protein-like surface antigen
MRLCRHCLLPTLLAGVLAAACGGVAAQNVSPRYLLTAPTPQLDPELTPRTPLLRAGSVQLSAASSMTGSGLSLQAGHQWFARAGLGRSLESDVLSVGGGYRFQDGEALSMHVTRQLGQERLGLAVRYDWTRSYLRLSYESALRATSGPDTLRFSAGLRF